MARNGSQHFAFHQESQDTQPSQQMDGAHLSAYQYNDDDDAATLLDPTMLGMNMMPHSQHNMQYRRTSLPQAHGVMSPADSQAWDATYPSTHAMEHSSSATGLPHFREDPNAYRGQPPHHHQSRAVNTQLLMQSQWPQQPDAANNATNNNNSNNNNNNNHGFSSSSIDMLPPQMPVDHIHMSHVETEEQAQHIPVINDQNFAPTQQQVQTPVSPQSHQEWMAFAQQEIESRPLSKRMRPVSPPRSLLDLRRDGAIQKKNKRIDIPHERNIQTIDQMIETTKDEELLKELKAQKRLLRNREAALASRQRKKKHTEDLEKSEKSYVTQISSLEKDLETLALERNNLHRDREILIHRHQDAERVIEAMHMEKRDLIMKHTEETASLRKKVQVLMEQLEAASAPAMSAAPSSAGFTDFNAEMEALSMGAHDWDHFMLINDMPTATSNDLDFNTPHGDQQKLPVPAENKASTSVVDSTALPTVHDASRSDKPVASGLLFMLLLCGAFVASQPAASSSLNLPPMPPDVQAAAPTVLNSLLADNSAAGVPHDTSATSQQHVKREPAPSARPRSHARASDRMTQLHRSLTAPSRQQKIDSAFALTQSQYAAYSNSDSLHDDTLDSGSATPRQTLADALANQFSSSSPTSENKAEVYTRSLLWDQIPADVVQQFKQMVQSRANLNTHGL